jgi:RecA-family ATPase
MKKRRSLLKAEPINEGLSRSYSQPNPKKLFGQFWWENELVICFASTNVGKTLLAMQIAESLATGTQVFDCKDNPCSNETNEMKVLYVDAELTYKQIENRYKNPTTGENYTLSSNIIRAEIDRNFEWKKGDNMEELVKVDIRNLIEQHKPKALIVDNLKMLKSGTEKSQEALPLMFELNNLKGKYNISILVLGHTPKIDLLTPIQINHLSGSSDIANACDGIFAIAKTKEDNSSRYIKELKQRNVEFRFGSNNVLLCTIEQPKNFTGFTFNSLVKEIELLNEFSNEAKKNLEKLILKFHNNGMSSREIATMIPYGKTKVAQIIKEKCPSSEDSKGKTDSLDKEKQLDLIEMSEVSMTPNLTRQSLM